MLVVIGYLETTQKLRLLHAYSCTNQPSSVLLKPLNALKSKSIYKGSELVLSKKQFVCKTLPQLTTQNTTEESKTLLFLQEVLLPS